MLRLVRFLVLYCAQLSRPLIFHVEMLHNQRDDWCHCKLHKWRRTSSYGRWLDYDYISWYLGLLLLAGVYRGRHESVNHLWSVEQDRPIFGAAMARNRFQMITRCMHFDSKDTRLERRQRDKMAPIRDIHDTFAARCLAFYKSRSQLCIDEQLVVHRGRCPFKIYIPSKPGSMALRCGFAVDVWYIICLQCGAIYKQARTNSRSWSSNKSGAPNDGTLERYWWRLHCR